MPGIRGFTFALVCLHFLAICVAENATGNARILSRPKRYLIFPEGSNIQVLFIPGESNNFDPLAGITLDSFEVIVSIWQLVFCLTVGTYAKENDVVMGITAALAWELPSKVDSKISELLHRRSRGIAFPKIEALLQS